MRHPRFWLYCACAVALGATAQPHIAPLFAVARQSDAELHLAFDILAVSMRYNQALSSGRFRSAARWRQLGITRLGYDPQGDRDEEVVPVHDR